MTKQQWSSMPEMQIDPDKTYEVMIESSRGSIEPVSYTHLTLPTN